MPPCVFTGAVMSTIEVTRAETSATGTWILLGRHAVAIAAVLAVFAALAPKFDGFLLTWAGISAFVFGLAALVAGFGLLFFTRRERGKTAITFRNTAWVLAGLLLLDPLIHALNLPAGGDQAKTVEARVPPAVTLDQTSDQALNAAARTVLKSAKLDGTIDYAADKTAQVQFDKFVAMLRLDPENAGKSALELAQQAHLSMLALRGIAKKGSVPEGTKVSAQASLAAECLERSGQGVKPRPAKLADMRKRYPFLADRDDVAVVRAVHRAHYNDLPVVCVADALGVEMSA